MSARWSSTSAASLLPPFSARSSSANLTVALASSSSENPSAWRYDLLAGERVHLERERRVPRCNALVGQPLELAHAERCPSSVAASLGAVSRRDLSDRSNIVSQRSSSRPW